MKLKVALEFAETLLDDLDETVIIRQLEYHYPSGKTVIKVGEDDIDYFDDIVKSTTNTEGLIDNTL